MFDIDSIIQSKPFKCIDALVIGITALGLIIAAYNKVTSFYRTKIDPQRKQNQYSARRLELRDLKRCKDEQSMLIATFAGKAMFMFAAFFYTLLTTGMQTINLIFYSKPAITIFQKLGNVATVLIIIGLWAFIISLAISWANFFKKVKQGQPYLDKLEQDIREMKKQSPDLRDTPKLDFLDNPLPDSDKPIDAIHAC